MGDARDFRARLRALARARARGEKIPAPAPPSDSVIPFENVWPARRGDGLWVCEPRWPRGYPAPHAVAASGGAVAFDVESLGRTPKPLFLVGLARLDAGGVRLEQYVAGHPDEEGAVLREAAAALAGAATLLSYNGRTFDVPIIRDRLRYWRMPFEKPRHHEDLLGLVRRHYRDERHMPACGLAEAERYVLGVQRPPDIPSSQVPELYERFVKVGDARALEPVLRHNLYDLAATTLLYLKILGEIPAAFEDAAAAEPEPLF